MRPPSYAPQPGNYSGEIILGGLRELLGPDTEKLQAALAAAGIETGFDADAPRLSHELPVQPQLIRTGWDFFMHQVLRAFRDQVEHPVHLECPVLLPGPRFEKPLDIPGLRYSPQKVGCLEIACEEAEDLRAMYRIRYTKLRREEQDDVEADIDTRPGRTHLMKVTIKLVSQYVDRAFEEGLAVIRS